ncbi:MAG: alpha/beta hydrolase [Chloroflexi bacterium]|nr:alpha/beta hydrolase [Chloroflexota bacterium]
MSVQDMRVDIGSIGLQIREYKREGDAIVFLHFGGANLQMWQRVVPYFQDHYRLILVDLRGHGKSDKPQKGYHIDEMARDVVGVMEHLGLEQAHIIGSSLGAEVGLCLAANYPEKTISLVCEGALHSEYGPCGVWEGSEAAFNKHVASRLETIRNTPEPVFDSVDALVDKSRQKFVQYDWWNEYFEAVNRYDAYKIDEGKYTHAWRKPAKEDYMKHYFEYRFEDYYKRTKCPILMLPDEELSQNEKTAMETLSKLAHNAKIVSVPGWVHPFGWLLDPKEASKVVLEFLREAL